MVLNNGINMQKVIVTNPEDIRDCIQGSVEGYFKQLLIKGIRQTNTQQLVDELSAHMFGNVTLGLIGRQGAREREHPLPTLCDGCREWFAHDGVDVDTLTTAEVLQIAYETGYMVGDHKCDSPATCICSCTN